MSDEPQFDPVTVPALYINQFTAQINDEGVRVVFGEASAIKVGQLQPRIALFFTHAMFAQMQKVFVEIQQQHLQNVMIQKTTETKN